jgi:hypothetical protein
MESSKKESGNSAKNNRRARIFLFFLVLSSIIWLLIELSKPYSSEALFKVEYEGVPSDKLLQNNPLTELIVNLNAPGFSLLRYKLKTHTISFDLYNLSKKGSKYYLLPNNQLSKISAQLSGGTEVLSIAKDTIFIDLGNNISKMIPVVSNLEIQYKIGYNLIEELKIDPDSVLISGAEKYIDSIDKIATVPFVLEEVSQDVNLNLELQLPEKNDQILYSVSQVLIQGKVDKFTEGRFSIPVIVINEPDGVKINPFPKEIEIVYQAGLSDFDQISKNSFSIVFDYKQLERDSLINYLKPSILKESKFALSYKIIPNQIEFLIQK